MIILGIETSCDETALSIIEATGNLKNGITIRVLANNILSQIALHQQYGGVFPNLAKREHAKNLIPLFKKALEESNFLDSRFKIQDSSKSKKESETYLLTTSNLQLSTILKREPELLKQFLEFIPTIEKPPTRPVRNRGGSTHTSLLRDKQCASVSNGIDLIAVTAGPGLEPALWVGINFAKALSIAWNIPVVATNHMEGHIFSALLRTEEKHKTQYTKTKQTTKENSSSLHATRYTIHAPAFPALALLISGGHTELVLIKDWFQYEIVGKTRDDAVGEAFDKVARILGLPYPGGPEISALAETARKSQNYELGIRNYELKLPRPMIHSDNLDFSFSGLKTAVANLPKDESNLADLAASIEQVFSSYGFSLSSFEVQRLLQNPNQEIPKWKGQFR
ncbi:MAG: hypothetical protein HY001_02955, partial [Candidatus Portnoybacteria bacterium]|nr:hypothetical protein [Candidatus Portnoybacteria bacterium]